MLEVLDGVFSPDGTACLSSFIGGGFAAADKKRVVTAGPKPHKSENLVAPP